jgi:hypothetical protein
VGRTEIVVFSSADDLHALAVVDHLNSDRSVAAHLVAADRLAFEESLTWSARDPRAPTGRLRTVAGGHVDVGACHGAWWRRVFPSQRERSRLDDEGPRELLDRNCGEALTGLVQTCFTGAWVSDPQRTRTAANKLVQSVAAAQAGFRVPRTLVTQDPERVRRFAEELDGHVVLKPVAGSPRAPLLTLRLRPEHLECADPVRAMPTIYQELIPGEVHLRVNCFGDDVHAVEIRSRDLDWRGDLDVPMSTIRLPADLEDRLRTVLRSLGLRMGIVDLKVTPDGEPVWLEVNPQGQFLFLQPLVDVDYLDLFARFLIDESRGGTP